MAAGNTYVALASTTLTGNAGSVTLSSISSAYTDLVLVLNIIGNAAQDTYFGINGDTGTNYSSTLLTGNGTTATSTRASNQGVGYIASVATSTTNPNFNAVVHFQNYSNTTTYKTVLARSNNASTGTQAVVSLWRSTAAITSINISPSTSSYAAGSTFTLYGILAA